MPPTSTGTSPGPVGMPERRWRTSAPHRRRVPVAYCAHCGPTGGVEPARGAARDAYRSVTCGLLPTLRGDRVDGTAVGAALGGVAIRIVRYAPMWGEHGAILMAAAHGAVRLFRVGDWTGLAALLQVTAGRLQQLATGAGMRLGVGGSVHRSPDWKGYRHE